MISLRKRSSSNYASMVQRSAMILGYFTKRDFELHEYQAA